MIFALLKIADVSKSSSKGKNGQLADCRQNQLKGGIERKADKQVNHLKDGNSDKPDISFFKNTDKIESYF
jgi:hypothetical protein